MAAPWLPFASLGTQAKIGKFGKNVLLLRKSLAENARPDIGGDNQGDSTVGQAVAIRMTEVG